jgi:hypothetical protein
MDTSGTVAKLMLISLLLQVAHPEPYRNALCHSISALRPCPLTRTPTGCGPPLDISVDLDKMEHESTLQRLKRLEVDVGSIPIVGTTLRAIVYIHMQSCQTAQVRALFSR